MRLSIAVLVAIQASMGLAHAIPHSDEPHTIPEKKRESFRDLYKKYMLGLETKKDATLELADLKTDKYETKGPHGDFKYRIKHYYPYDHESDHEYEIKEKYKPNERHTITKVNIKKYYPHKHHENEDVYDHKDKYNDVDYDHGYNDYRSENHHYEHEKDYETKKFDAFNDRYGLNKHDFEKQFTEPLKEYEPKDSHDKGNHHKRWPPLGNHGDRSFGFWHPDPFPNFNDPLQKFDPNEEHTHSYKTEEKPKYPERPESQGEKYHPKDVHDSKKHQQNDLDIFNPGYHTPEKYDAEVKDEKLSHFHKYEQENDNLPYFDKFPKTFPPEQPFDEDKKGVPKAEYEGEDDHYHSMDPEDWHHNREIHKKPDYDKEDREEYHDDGDKDEQYPKHDFSPKDEEYGMKGVHGFKYEYHPDEKSFLSEEAQEKLKHDHSDFSETYSFKEYFPREEVKEKKYTNEAEKLGYRKYDPTEDDDKHNHSDEKSHHPEEEKDNESDSKEVKHASKQIYYPSDHEPEESAKYYRKQEVDHDSHKSNEQPYARKEDQHYGYYKEPGYESVVPGFMWAGPGTVTKTPCTKKEGCPHGHWHMLEPKNGEHRRIGITGTNIVVEPDFTKPDYKEDTVNHVLPGYENVIPGFEWAGVGVVTEVPCRSAADCPEGGWFMLAPKFGEHRRIAMNFPKATAKPHHHHASGPTVQVHKSDYKARSPVGHEGVLYQKDHEEEDRNEREYKLIHRHSSGLSKRSIEARVPCKKQSEEEKEKERQKNFKKIDPNKPVPRLDTPELLNIEALSDEKRQAVVAAFPIMGEEFNKEFLEFQELTPELINKLNELYAILLESEEGKVIVNIINRNPKYVRKSKRSVPELSEKQIDRIEDLTPAIRQVLAKKLDFDPKLTLEFVNADELSDDLIARLNKEYTRVVRDPKYAKIIKKFMSMSNSKRAEAELTKEMLNKIEGLSPIMREIVAKKLDFSPELSDELANADKLSDDLVAKLNKEYARVVSDPKYAKIIEKFKSNSNSKRAEPELSQEMISKVESMSPSMRMMAAQKLDMDPELTSEMANAEKFTPELIEKLNKEYARITRDPKYKNLLDKIGFKQKRAEKTPELSKTELTKIEGMSPSLRLMVAKRLGIDAKLSIELANAVTFTPEMIKKLNKEFARVYNDPKYEDILAQLISKSKRTFTRELTDQQLDKISNMSESERRMIAEKLNFKKELADEFIKSEQFTPHIVKKLNEVYNQIFGGHKYNELVDHFRNNFKRHVVPEPKGEEEKQEEKQEKEEEKDGTKGLKNLTKQIREQITKNLDFKVNLDGEFLYAQRITESLIGKLGDLVRDTILELEWEEIVEDLLDEDEGPEEKETSDTKKTTKTPETESLSIETTPEFQGNQTVSAQNSTTISGRQATSDLDKKLEQSKKNGWCKEFLGTLKDTWDDSVDEALSKTKE
ncbi:hypothetical protein ACHAO7_005118 [Fusarium culmorum]